IKCELFSTKKQRYVIFPWEGCLTIIADSDEMQELREELYQVKQAVKGIKDGMFSVLNEN
ncbi:hypothetical protein FSJ31_023940, partial [Escherichia coli]|nr:hypothetical protein [Escherichia coli]